MGPKKNTGAKRPRRAPDPGVTRRQTRGQRQEDLWEGLTDRGEAYDAQGNHVLVRPVRQRRGTQESAAHPPPLPCPPRMPSPPIASSDDESCDKAGDEPEAGPDEESEAGPGNESEAGPGNESEDKSGNEPDTGSGDEPAAGSGDESEAGSGNESEDGPNAGPEDAPDDTAGPSSAPTSPKPPPRKPLPTERPKKITIKLNPSKTATAPAPDTQSGTESDDSDSPIDTSAAESDSDASGDVSDEESPKKKKTDKGKQKATNNKADTDSDPEVTEVNSDLEEPEEEVSQDDSEEQNDSSRRDESSDPEGSQNGRQITAGGVTPPRESTPESDGGNSGHISTPSKTSQDRKGRKSDDPIQIDSGGSEQSDVDSEQRSEESLQEEDGENPEQEGDEESSLYPSTIVHDDSDDETEMLVYDRPDPDQTIDYGDNTLNLTDYPSSVVEGPNRSGEYDGSDEGGDNEYRDQSSYGRGGYGDNDDRDDDSKIHLPNYTMFDPDDSEGQPEMGRGQGSESNLSRQSSPGGVSPGFPRHNRSPSHSPDPSAGGQQLPSGSSGGQGSTAQGRKSNQSQGSSSGNKGSASGGGNGSAATKTKSATGKRGRPEDLSADSESRPQKRQREDLGKATMPTISNKIRCGYRPYPRPLESQPQTSDKRASAKRPSSSLDETVVKPGKKTRLV
ncbi:hypothetical protein BDP81DRAFT_174058 [Colletotrichum phormii]|uniref:Uncharacterized protein n=1 Tax=Colletotrichum phormii TaxID=359342 RepID=A0AAJ0E8D9_9PEZI|nr:uncharacterized protein BDP81DRAFT_174058 [Colletotrichum phormii]KAK1621570.1 hypothetical protein BDP81DRAFT_174058 [Colletotrichum phormii]